MNIFVLNNGADTGGQGIRIKQAFDRYNARAVAAARTEGRSPDSVEQHRVRAMHTERSFMKYPRDLEWDEATAQRLFDEADVVHVQNSPELYRTLDRGRGKPLVVHHQGTRLRSFPEDVTAESAAVGAVQIVSTVDLLADCPGAEWLPIPHDIDWIRDTYRQKTQHRPLRIVHAPTNRQAKGTQTVIDVVAALAAEGMPIELKLVEGLPWKVALSWKGQADIVIDQLTIGYGNNGVEAMAMGVPLISGWAEDDDRERFRIETGWEIPFAEANSAETLERCIRELAASPELREEVGARGRAFVEEFHDDVKIAGRLVRIYERAIAGSRPARGEWLTSAEEDDA